MKKKFEHKESRGLPGGPNEIFTYVTGVFDIYQAPSNIEGQGMFAGKPFKKGDFIGLAHSNGQPASQLGRMHNHNENSPTMISKKSGNDRFVFAAKDLQPGDELTTNYRMQPELEQPEDFQFGGSITAPPRKGVRKNPDGSESTHLMATETLDGKNWFSFPTLFQDPDGTWIDMSDKPWKEAYEEAKRRGEVIEFGTDKEAAIKFGEGSWKLPKAQDGGEETSWTDYINPMNWGVTNRDEAGNFKQAFRAARADGDDEFMWHGERYNTELAPAPEKPKEEKLFYNKDILKGLSEEQTARRQSLLNAANAVASAQGDDDNLRKLLVMSAVMENTLGADPKAYGRDYTRSPMSIDDIAYDDLFNLREGARGYTTQQKKNASWLEGLGINASDVDSLLRADDPMASMAVARLVYGRAPEALPSGDDPDALYNYYLKYYNKGGVDKYGGAEAHRKKFNDYYNQIYREFGGETDQLKIYKDYVYGVYDGTEMQSKAEKVYDKLNRVFYKEAKQSGTTVPNYILTKIMKQSDN